MDQPVVRLDRMQPGVAVITLDRPEVRNAVNWQSWRELGAALGEVSADPDCRALVLTGTGGAFCAGGDVKSSPAHGHGLGAPVARLTLGHQVLRDLIRVPIPVLAAVEGPAVGVGWSLALACDLVVAADDAVFGAPFVLRGLVPDGGAGWFLTRLIGRHRAARLLLTGERVPARAAADAGLVTQLASPGEALPEALELAATLARGAPEALRLTKGLVRAAEDLPLDRYLEMEWLSATLDSTGPDPVEGRAAFVEKREPDFSRLRELPPR